MNSFRSVSLVALAVCASFLGGCHWEPWGMGKSDDRFTYVSTAYRPYTVTLVDTRTSQTIWTTEVPVGQELTVQFLQPFDGEATGKTVMKWELFPARGSTSSLANSITVPPASARALKVYIRETPESRPDAADAPAATAQSSPPSTAPASPSIILPDATQPAPSQRPAEKSEPSEVAPEELPN